ncbi:glycoside hydrolase family 2 protein [Roseateles saccharophilus]|uniref:beta-mannosidase n=1 Tax=Roseateles saccharophilus TaxID=304 RepID=A0A4R3URG2_ROSSA|nr:glycoside hydrolase family 2 protein [Roseateles saccharophilus]MDG0833693.1 glycoside hydrolase family 2 protein [Roseateles saccharophilus]TCU93280.1 beta-mannosidase [Roseateles saccharophilus]
MTPERLIDLHDGWQLAEAPEGLAGPALAGLPDAAWLPARVPGTAHGALLAAGRIPDPFYGRNEAELRWVGERRWAWRLRFDAGELAAHEDLVFEGLDTYCTAWLNGERLLDTDNMFVPHRVDVRERLRPGCNELLLCFEPALARARAVEAVHGKRALWNGDSARLHVRKAQYHFGWDWGPELIVGGPWRAVRRHAWSARIDELQCRSSLDGPRATLQVAAELAGAGAGQRCSFELLDPEGRCVAEAVVPASAVARATLSVAGARLWWPRGLGGQPLYTLVARVLDGERVLAESRCRTGLRTLRLVQEPVEGEAGSSFHFEVNGQAFFAGGANWIPDDNLLERIAPARYRERVAQAAAANMNMLRVWGGGVYEHEAFYEACDEQGLLVWQDFMFACGIYPANAEFLASVRAEAEAAVKRLRHHACLALWCGNNEDYMLAESVGLAGPGVQAERFEARAIYEGLLPEVCAALDPDRVYWPGSPFTPGADTKSSDATVGDRHSWEVWHQQMLPYQRYGDVQARFVSEFGMQSHPSLALLESVLPEGERFPESRTVQWHNKAGSATGPDGHRRLAVYLADNLRVGPTLAEHVYATQFVQAEAMRVAYQDFRRRWQQPGARAVGGALVWQLNDCWPVTSWALIDSAGTAKPAWHAVRRALSPLAVAVRLEAGQARLAVMNGGLQPCVLTLQLRVFALDGRELAHARLAQEVPASTSLETTQALPDFTGPVVAELCALDEAGTELARDCAWTEPFRFYRLGSARIDIRRDGQTLLLGCDRPVKGLWLQGAALADNFIDLVPGAPRRVAVAGAWPQRLQVMALEHAARVVAIPEAGG